VSPILTRPVREQLEHDRVIRLLQARYKRKTDVIINPGSEQNQSVTVENLVVFPDVLIYAEGGKKLLGTVEVETGESVNALEARAEWGVFCKLKVPMYLYVPAASVDTARRLIAEYAIPVAEVWSFTVSYDQIRFTMIYRSPDAPVVKMSPATEKPAAKPVVKAPAALIKPEVVKPKPASKPVPKPAAKPVVKAKAKAPGKAAAKLAAKPKPAPKAAVKAPLRQGYGGQAQKAKAPLRQGSGGQAQKAKGKPVAKASKPVAKPAKAAKPKPAKKRR